MQNIKNTFTSILGILLVAVLILMSYRHGSIFMEQILMCSFILATGLMARLRSGIQKGNQEKEQHHH